MTSTIRDVADLAGVSIATVSRVMNDRPDVGVATRERVLDAARELGYVTHGPARALATSRSQLVGVVMPPGVTRPEVVLTFFGEVIDSVTRHLDDHGYDGVLLHSATPGHAYFERVARHAMQGLLLMGSIDARDFAQVPDDLPCVGLDTDCAGPNRGSVIFDDADGIRLCLRHLYAHGHRSIAYLGGPPVLRPAATRLDAFRSEAAALGVTPPDAFLRECDWSAEAGYREACALFVGDERPTAILAASDLTAVAAMQAIRDFGLEPGRDVAVTGFDDISVAALAHPPLTTVRQDRERLGAIAVSSLVELMDRPGEEGPQVVLPVNLVVRASTTGRAG
jgi:LacI family transcriptional regulator, galactose operon repressor